MSGTVDCTNKRPHTHTQTNQSKALKVDDVIVMQYLIRRRATSETHLYTCTTQTSSNTFIKSKRLSTHTRSRAVNSAVAQCTFYLDGPNERIWLRGKNCKTKWGSETIKFSKNKDGKKKKKKRLWVYEKGGFDWEMKEGRVSLGTEWCTPNGVICSLCCWWRRMESGTICGLQ